MKRAVVGIALCLVICFGIVETASGVSWNNCIVSGAAPCPSACIQSGYTSNQNSTQCGSPSYSFCFGITDACNTNSDNVLQGCLDYGFTNNTLNSACTWPVCVDGINPCPTTTTYCTDQNYTNVNNICTCKPPQIDYQGQCTDALSSLKLISFFALIVILTYPFF